MLGDDTFASFQRVDQDPTVLYTGLNALLTGASVTAAWTLLTRITTDGNTPIRPIASKVGGAQIAVVDNAITIIVGAITRFTGRNNLTTAGPPCVI